MRQGLTGDKLRNLEGTYETLYYRRSEKDS
jgi:hypothetical protein